MFLTTKCLPYSITASSVPLKLSTISELCYFVNRQKYCVICLQVGKQAETHVWDATTMRTVSVLKGFHKRGVICVDFSGTYWSTS